MSIVQSFDDLRDLSREMEGHNAKRNSVFHTDEEYYHLNFLHHLDLPSEFSDQGVVLPTAREIIDNAADHVSPSARRVEVPPRKDSQKAIDESRRMKLFYEALLNYFERRSRSTPYRQVVKHLATLGMGVFKILYDPTKGPKKPKQKPNETNSEYNQRLAEWEVWKTYTMPFVLQVPHPSNIFPDPWHDTAEWVIEKKNMKAGQAQVTYPDWDIGNHRITNNVEAVEYWDAYKRVVMIDNKPALMTEHDYTVHPYVIGSSGLGYISEDRSPEDEFVGFLRFIRDVLHSESRNYSIADIVLRSSAWPQRVAVGDRASEMDSDFAPKFGTVKPLPDGVSIESLTPELPPHMVYEHLGISSNIISAAAAPRVTRGGQEPGTRSGFQQQIQLGQARLKYEPLALSLQNMMSDLCMKAGILMENVVPAPVSISVGNEQSEFIDVPPSLWKGHRSVNVRINVLEPEDEIRKHNDLMQQITAGILSQEDAIKEAHPNKDPQRVKNDIIKERVMQALIPVLGQAVAADVAENLEMTNFANQLLGTLSEEGQQRGRQQPQADGGQVTGDRSDQAQLREQDGRELGV